jgi:hypothetical protein
MCTPPNGMLVHPLPRITHLCMPLIPAHAPAAVAVTQGTLAPPSFRIVYPHATYRAHFVSRMTLCSLLSLASINACYLCFLQFPLTLELFLRNEMLSSP